MSIDEKNLDSEQIPDPNHKAKGYFGLLIALTFLIVMHLQLDLRRLGEHAGFFQKTFTNGLVWSGGRGGFVYNYERTIENCESARRVDDCSSFPNRITYSEASLDRIKALDPEYEANFEKYLSLLNQAEQEEADIYSYPETKEVAEKLLTSVHKEYLNAQTWLTRMNIFAHLLVVILSLFGLRYRRGLGHLASAPLRWAISAGKSGLETAKDIHKKI